MSFNNTEFFERSNQEFEKSFKIASEVSKIMESHNDCLYAAKKIFSYNPNSQLIQKEFPEIAECIKEISKIVDHHGLLLKNNVKIWESWIKLGHCYLALGDFPNSFASYCHSMRINSNIKDPITDFTFGVVFIHYKYYEAGIQSLLRSISIDTNYFYFEDAMMRIAISYRLIENYSTSLQFFEKIIYNPPNHLPEAEIQLQISYTYQLSGQPQLTFSILNSLLLNNSKNIYFLHHYLFFLFLYPQYGNIQDFLNSIFYLCPNDPVFNLIQGRIFLKLQKIEQAYFYYKNTIQHWIDNAFFWLELANLYYLASQNQDVIGALNRVIFLDPTIEISWINLIFIYFKNNLFDEAIKISTKSLQYISNPEFQTKITLLLNSKGIGFNWINNDDFMDLENYPLKFSNLYLASPPILPSKYYDLDINLNNLTNYPISIFSKK